MLMRTLSHPVECERLSARLVYLAWHKYRIASQEAADVVQAALATYLEVRDRYAGEQNQMGILVGIFNKKCLEHIERSVRDRRRLDAYVRNGRAKGEVKRLEPEGRGAEPSAADRVICEEDSRLILESIQRLRPEARRMVRLIGLTGMTRKELIEHYGVNKNTLDSRLRTFRQELRGLLLEAGIRI